MSAYGPGTPNRWHRPIRQDGARDLGVTDIPHSRMAGTYTGDYGGMNLLDPRPGKAYQWVSLIGADGTLSARGERVVMAQTRGWRVARQSTSGVKAAVDSADVPNAPRGNQANGEGEPITFGTQILMEIDEWQLGELRQREFELARKLVDNAASGFINNVSPNESALGQGRPTRFARQDHHATLNQGGEVIDTIYNNSLPRD